LAVLCNTSELNNVHGWDERSFRTSWHSCLLIEEVYGPYLDRGLVILIFVVIFLRPSKEMTELSRSLTFPIAFIITLSFFIHLSAIFQLTQRREISSVETSLFG